MSSFARVLLMGRLGHSPHIQTTRNGKPYCRLSVATDTWYPPETEGAKSEKKTNWHSVHVFGKQAELAVRYLQKGRAVFIEGRFETSTDPVDLPDGKKNYKTWINADRVTFLGSPRLGEENATGESTLEIPSEMPSAMH